MNHLVHVKSFSVAQKRGFTGWSIFISRIVLKRFFTGVTYKVLTDVEYLLIQAWRVYQWGHQLSKNVLQALVGRLMKCFSRSITFSQFWSTIHKFMACYYFILLTTQDEQNLKQKINYQAKILLRIGRGEFLWTLQLLKSQQIITQQIIRYINRLAWTKRVTGEEGSDPSHYFCYLYCIFCLDTEDHPALQY